METLLSLLLKNNILVKPEQHIRSYVAHQELIPKAEQAQTITKSTMHNHKHAPELQNQT
jgi:hypothetical protein